jgi:hypothetical protein
MANFNDVEEGFFNDIEEGFKEAFLAMCRSFQEFSRLITDIEVDDG